MNLQTEHLENRIAQLKVEIAAADLEQAKRQAARKLAKRVNIPGFRKGKAPYNIITRYLGEGAILEEAIDDLGPKVYSEAVDEAELEPYGPGQLDNIDTSEENGLVLTFNVPLVPTVDLGSYREVRRDFELPEVTDTQVEDVISMMMDNKATLTVKEGPAAAGDSAKLDILGDLVAEETDEDSDSTEAETLFNQTNWTYILGEAFREPMPGFSAAVEGIVAGEERSFDLTFPAESDDFDEMLLGKTVTFTVNCHEISAREMPELNDEFVKELGEEGVETLEELRAKIRADLETNVKNRTESEYAEAVLDAMVEGATIEFPELMVEDTIDDMIKRFEQQLGQQGMDLDTFLKMRQIEMDALRADYHEPAIGRLKRSLLLGELAKAEQLELDNRAVDKAVRDRAAQMADGNEEFQKIFEQYLGGAQGRRDLGIELMTQQAYDRLVAIARGEEPEIGPVPFVEEEVEEETSEAAAEAPESVEATDEEPVAEAVEETNEEEAESEE